MVMLVLDERADGSGSRGVGGGGVVKLLSEFL